MLARFAILLFLLNCAGCSGIGTSSKQEIKYSQLNFETISSIGEVPALVSKILSEETEKSTCWIIFDIDYTLTMPALVHENKKYVVSKESLLKAVEKIKDDEKFDQAISATLFFPQILIDKRTPKILYSLRGKGRKIFALTAAVGSERHKQIRAKTLNSMNITFDKTFSFPEISLDDITPYAGQCPSFLNGILYANGERDPNNDKGRVLVSFMQKIQESPDCIVVIDDRKRNLEDIEKALSDTNIKFFGLLYDFPKKYDEVPTDILEKHISDVLKKEDFGI